MRPPRAVRPLPPDCALDDRFAQASGRRSTRGPSARMTISMPPSLRSAPTSSRPPRTSASPAIIARLSSNLTAPLGSWSPATIQPSSIRFSGPYKPFERGLGLARVDLVAETARRAERETKEFELVGARPRAFGEQFEAALAHFGVLLVGEQFDAIVERPDRRQQIMAQAANTAGWQVRSRSWR